MESTPYLHLAELFGMQAPPGDDRADSTDRRGDTPEASAILGRQCLEAGDLKAAIEHFRTEVQQLDPEEIDGLLDLAGALVTADMVPQALRQYERALQVRKDAPEARLGLAEVFKLNARYRDSIRELEVAISLEPTNAFYHYKMASLLREMGELPRALVAASGAVATAPDDSFYHFWIGDLLMELRRYEDALGALQAALELSPGDDYLYLRTAVAFWGAGKRDKAVRSVRLASELDPDKQLYYGVLELFLSSMGEMEEAALERVRAETMDTFDRAALQRIRDELAL